MSVPMDGVELQNGYTSQYSDVLYKKRKGILMLYNNSSIAFHPEQQGVPDDTNKLSIKLIDIAKHQVSPATYPKALLKIILTTSSKNSSKSSSLTFQMVDRDELERIRKDITKRLQTLKSPAPPGGSSNRNKKRPHSDLAKAANYQSASYGELDPTAVAVTRSALLSANAALRQQHNYLVTETSTVSEDDFWQTHQHLLEDEYARISGMARAGTSSVLQSHLPSSGRVTLGVEEMRQIFILYPAVHKAYEEKVPLELSDEQFWRKYLESEYFHRDRGRMGTAARDHAPSATIKKQDKDNKGPSYEQENARAAAVGTDDIFSRYAEKLQEAPDPQAAAQGGGSNNGDSVHRKWGTRLAVGQFDLASTFESDRGQLLEGPKDNHPPNQSDDGKGARVIRKYNRHWALVLHPDEAIAGSNLMEVARKSTRDTLPGNTDAQVQGGVDVETKRLVDFADASEADANHAVGVGLQDGDEYEPLTLRNVEAYYSGKMNTEKDTNESNEDAAKRHAVFAKSIMGTMLTLVAALDATTPEASGHLPETCFPPAGLGFELLSALTKKMAKDSQTEAESLEMVNKLPADFRDRLQNYFRRSSELLRHFFGLRRCLAVQGGTENSQHGQKLARIVRGMETFYREMEGMRRDLPQTEIGEMMRKMCLPIMEQLDWAFKLHREGSGGGGGGGFVTVEQL